MVRSLRSVPNGNGRAVDSDGDGLKDDNDQPFVHGSNQFIGDSDGDCFDDNFEVIHADLGFAADKQGHPRLRSGLAADPQLRVPRHRR